MKKRKKKKKKKKKRKKKKKKSNKYTWECLEEEEIKKLEEHSKVILEGLPEEIRESVLHSYKDPARKGST